ncbi:MULTISPECIES: beta-xylosidase family glycoside hydrolase [Clostridium]|uniref:Beta-xylosidase C-terminal Concanavalin A-like domain-containing protein n=1 Tax=Clostridium frigoriphilum TaxID=443253 RepID=A0ABU7UPA9_9CLOT|nr:hypothetical protein [Clostridium sp. DSM 17811]MBU3100234.1 hypothetical protein [Clostridium sp. DSM 17811]
MVSNGIILINNLEFERKKYLIKGLIVMKSIHNPILEGFNPDPCILKVKGVIKIKDNKFFDDFDKKDLNSEWSTLRIFPNSSWLNIIPDKSIIRIAGAESPQSTFDQHIIAIRQSDINFSAETVITFEPTK